MPPPAKIAGNIRRARALLQAATAHLQTLSSKLVKARHSLHSSNLKCEAVRVECSNARREVSANDAMIAALLEEEQALKLEYVNRKLAYEKAHADKYSTQQELKQLRSMKRSVAKERDAARNALAARRIELSKAYEQHMQADENAQQLSSKLEAVEKAKEESARRVYRYRQEVARYSEMYDALRQELDLVHASAAAVV